MGWRVVVREWRIAQEKGDEAVGRRAFAEKMRRRDALGTTEPAAAAAAEDALAMQIEDEQTS